MTDLTAEQNAMLERLLKKHGFRKDSLPINIEKHVKEVARELLLAVQERSAKLMECGDPKHHGWRREDCEECQRADLIRAQSYGDLFPEEPK